MSDKPKGESKFAVLKVLSVIVAILVLAAVVTLMILDRPGSITVHYIDAGQGDAILITCGTESMLIDGGSNDTAGSVEAYLSRQGIEKFKYVVATHPDGNHIGGLDTILEKYDVISGEIWMPGVDYNTKTFYDLIDAIDYCGLVRVCPESGTEYKLGKATVTVLGPTKTYEDQNDNSLVIKVVMGENSFLFTGDMTLEGEKDLLDKIDPLDLQADVIKLGNHGADNSTGKSFLKAVGAKYAVITVDGENEEGCPTADILNKLKEADISVYRTDESGSIVVKGNEVDYIWNVASSLSWKVGGSALENLGDLNGLSDSGNLSELGDLSELSELLTGND